MNIRKGDTVQIRTGKDKGKTGKVFRIDSKSGMLWVEKINLFKKHSKPKRQGEKGELVSVTRPFPASKAMLFCSNCKKGVRSGNRVEGNKRNKIRYCKKCKVTL